MSSPGDNGGVPESVHRPRRAARRSRPTINDVAAASGVSRGTVSRALNGGHDVSPAAMAAIRRAIEETGYVVNQHARSLVTQRSQSVAFILSEPQDRLFEDPNFNVLLHGCARALAEHDLTLVLTFAGTDEDRKRTARYITSGHVDGALLVSTHSGSPLIDELQASGVPVVACGKPLGHEMELAHVAADDRGGARQMTRYLRDQGRRRIATITGPLDTPGGVERLAGYHDVVGRRDDHDQHLIVNGDYTQAAGESAMTRLLAQAPDLDAVFVASDLMAAGALTALRRAGRSVPGDVLVGGFDDSKIATTTQPALTTIRQPWNRISHEMVRLLLALLSGERTAAVILPTELIVRDSA
jgi:DNA-binding LacI/PurR family transcriptional regulator